MKWLGRPSPFHLFTNPCVINRFIFGQGVVIYYILQKRTTGTELMVLLKSHPTSSNVLVITAFFQCLIFITWQSVLTSHPDLHVHANPE